MTAERRGRIPERHHRIAHEFVDRAVVPDDGGAQRGKNPIEDGDHLGGRGALAQGGEIAHIREHHRQIAQVATEPEQAFVLIQPVEQGRLDIMGEGPPDAALVGIGDSEPEESHGRIGQHGTWMETPDTASPRALARISSRPLAEAPMKTIWPAISGAKAA